MKLVTIWGGGFIFVLIAWNTFAYFINKKEDATVYLNDCLNSKQQICTKHQGSLSRTFFRQDYVVTNKTGNVVFIPKENVSTYSWTIDK